MGPVSFERLAADLTRDELLEAARLLTAAGIRVQSVTDGKGLLVRSEDSAKARELLDKPS